MLQMSYVYAYKLSIGVYIFFGGFLKPVFPIYFPAHARDLRIVGFKLLEKSDCIDEIKGWIPLSFACVMANTLL